MRRLVTRHFSLMNHLQIFHKNTKIDHNEFLVTNSPRTKCHILEMGCQEIISDRGWGEWNLETSVLKHSAFVHLLGLKSQSYYTSNKKELG